MRESGRIADHQCAESTKEPCGLKRWALRTIWGGMGAKTGVKLAAENDGGDGDCVSGPNLIERMDRLTKVRTTDAMM